MMEKSSTRTPSSGDFDLTFCMLFGSLSRQSKPALGDQAALNLVGPDADHPHQRMTQVLLESPVVDRAGRLLGQGGAHPENIERGLAEALHQFAGIDLADRAV